MDTTYVEIAVLLLMVLANGVLAMSEIAIVSSRKARLQHEADKGNASAALALSLAEKPNRILSTVQIGITLVGLLAGAYSGATLAEKLAPVLRNISWIGPYGEPVSLGIVVVCLTYFSLVLGELVPKRIALHHPEAIASFMARPMQFLSMAALPAVHLLGVSTDAVLRLLGVKPSTEAEVTEEEIRVMVDQATESGVFREEEQEMLERAMGLGDRKASSLMTPRIDVHWIDLEDTPETIKNKISAAPFSRFPVARGTLDKVVGIVQVKDLLAKAFTCEQIDFEAMVRQTLFIPENMRSLELMTRFKESGSHFAVVVDEYGAVAGIVTFNDILEALVGDIPMREVSEEPEIVQREDGSWLMDGGISIEEVEHHLAIEGIGGEERESFQTLAGFVLSRLGHIPKASEHFHWNDYRFEVVDMDGNRIDKVLISFVNQKSEKTGD